MADSTINVKDASGATVPVDTRTQADGDHRQVFTLGDGTATYTQTVRTGGDAVVGYAHLTTTATLSAVDAASTTTTATVGASTVNIVTGTPTANSTVSLGVEGMSSVTVQMGSSSGIGFYVERSVDGGTTWTPIPVLVVGTVAATVTVPVSHIRAIVLGECAGSSHIRVRLYALTSGNVVAKIVASPAPGVSPSFIPHPVRLAVPGGRTSTNVTATTTSTQLLASNAQRHSYSVYNDSTATLYLNVQNAASTTNFALKIGPGGYFESGAYSGLINGIWDAVSGAARVTDYYHS